MRHQATKADPRLTPAMFHVLLALSDGERHGYGIMLEVARGSDGTVRLSPGTLYRSIRVLLDAGLIVEADERPDPSLDDERRRYYRITDGGRQSVAGEAARLQRLVRMARDKQVLTPPVVGLADGGTG